MNWNSSAFVRNALELLNERSFSSWGIVLSDSRFPREDGTSWTFNDRAHSKVIEGESKSSITSANHVTLTLTLIRQLEHARPC